MSPDGGRATNHVYSVNVDRFMPFNERSESSEDICVPAKAYLTLSDKTLGTRRGL